MVDLKPEFQGTDMTVFQAGVAAKAAGEALQAGAADGGAAPLVVFTVSRDMVNDQGERREAILLTLFYRREDLMAARFDTLSAGRTLDLVDEVMVSPAAAGDVADYCLSERGQSQSRRFCQQAGWPPE